MKKIIAAATVATLTLAACGSDDVSPETLTDALVEQGIDRATAECISDDLSEQLSEDDFSAVARAETMDDMPDGLDTVVLDVTAACLSADG